MFKYFLIFVIIFFSGLSYADDNLLTLKQQLDRLQRDVNDLSKTVFQNSETTFSNDQIDSSNISAFDMRIYDLEKDIKILNSNFEELVFSLDEIKKNVDELNVTLSDLIINSQKVIKKAPKEDANSDQEIEKNTLGTLTINSEDLSESDEVKNEIPAQEKLSPDEEFQVAFDLLRSQKFDQAQESLENFIQNNKEIELSGSAHYWLGEIYMLKKNYREAALIFAEGFQKYPKSVKAPDMLFKLSDSLAKIEKINEACNTLNKFKKDYAANKLIEKVNLKFADLKCS